MLLTISVRFDILNDYSIYNVAPKKPPRPLVYNQGLKFIEWCTENDVRLHVETELDLSMVYFLRTINKSVIYQRLAGVAWKMDPPLKLEPGSIFNVEYGTRKSLNLKV